VWKEINELHANSEVPGDFAGALSSVTLAGCSSITSRDTNRHYVDLLNGSDNSHVFVVTVTNDDGKEIFNKEYDLESLTGDENRIIEGNPAKVSVTVDERKAETFKWDPLSGAGDHSGECSDGTSTSLSIYYDQQAGEGVKPVYSCETVRDQ